MSALMFSIAGALHPAPAVPPPVPMTLTGTLPATATVGTAYSGTLTLGGTFTAPVTIDASAGSIPAWMTVTVSGTTVTFAGTPDAAATVSFTPRATDSSATPQPALGPAQSITVGAASQGGSVQVVQVASTTSAATGSLLSASLAAVAAGDVIVAVASYGLDNPTWVFGASDSDGNAYSALVSQNGGGGATDIRSFVATAGAAGALTVSVQISGHGITGALTVYQLRGAAAPTAAACVAQGWTSLQAPSTDPVTPALALSAGGVLLTAASVFIYHVSPTLNPITPSAGTYTADTAFAYSDAVTLYAGHVTGAGAQSAMTVDFTHNPATKAWLATAIAIPIEPA